MKTDYIRIRLTEQEKAIMKEKAEQLNMNLTDYIKYCCLINPPKIPNKSKTSIET